MARLRPWLLFLTASVSFASCILNPGPELPEEAGSRGPPGDDTGGSTGAGASSGAGGTGAIGNTGGASTGMGGTVSTPPADGGISDPDAGPGGAGGEEGAPDGGLDPGNAG